eukprot:CAMPEP_0171679442 /NCGR_PEP_ID=MMETSP0990-20121206/56238_1 /TAXON_ID=483369 /ORGANISM="non described non described, Strain CCMP2098" /LENGTH=103 /DNA_ID=CAMNT_0012266225 /DNA_START=364 /DNA_END=676 /DNA_ORIENTATION=+
MSNQIFPDHELSQVLERYATVAFTSGRFRVDEGGAGLRIDGARGAKRARDDKVDAVALEACGRGAGHCVATSTPVREAPGDGVGGAGDGASATQHCMSEGPEQ